MRDTPQARAVANYRSRLSGRGMARFEVLARETDRELIRALARRLAEDTPEARKIRNSVYRRVVAPSGKKSSILVALRRSPLVDADLTLHRSRTEGRDTEL
jgi:hypothetical protein